MPVDTVAALRAPGAVATDPRLIVPADADLSHIIPELRPLAVPIDALIHDDKNARLHDEANLASIEQSFRKFGQRLPIYAQAGNNMVRVGNARLRMARERLKWKYIACIIHPDAEEMIKAFAIVDNRTAELGEWDYKILTELLADIQRTTPDLLNIGWDESDLDPLLRSVWAPPALDTNIGMEEDDGSFEGAATAAGKKTRTANNIANNEEYRTLINTIRVLSPKGSRTQDIDIVLAALRAYKRAIEKRAAQQ